MRHEVLEKVTHIIVGNVFPSRPVAEYVLKPLDNLYTTGMLPDVCSVESIVPPRPSLVGGELALPYSIGVLLLLLVSEQFLPPSCLESNFF